MREEYGRIKSLSKAIDILDAVCAHPGGITLGELAEACGYPRSTTHALISTMRDRGLINQTDSGRYTPGLKLFEYGSAVSRGFDISTLARPHLESLSSRTGANSVISRLDGADVVSFDYAVSPTGVQILPEIGVRLPLYCTSQGKLMLAMLPRHKAASVLRRLTLRPYTPHTIVTPEALSEELDTIRAQGYAVENGEYKVGLRSISAPVYDNSGEVRYALTTIGFFRRISSEDFVTATECTVSQAGMLSSALGK